MGKTLRIVVPERTDTNIRLYSDDDLKKLLNISILKQIGPQNITSCQTNQERTEGKGYSHPGNLHQTLKYRLKT
jgi:DNA-binding transcriptional MerR regulator